MKSLGHILLFFPLCFLQVQWSNGDAFDISELCVTNMATFSPSVQVASAIKSGTMTKEMAENLGHFFGQMHQRSRLESLGVERFTQLNQQFRANRGQTYLMLRSIMAPLIQPQMYEAEMSENSPAKRILDDARIRETVAKVHSDFLSKKECLICYSLLPYSVISSNDTVKLTNCNVVKVGAAASDVALIISYFIMAYHHQALTQQDNDLHHKVAMQLVDHCNAFADAYMSEIPNEEIRKKLMADIVSFTAVYVAARSLTTGPLAVDDSPRVAREGIDSAVRLFRANPLRINNVNFLLNIALALLW